MSFARRYEADFFTATILEWKHLLADDKYKNVIIDSMKFMVEQKRVIIHAFVVMNNHMHIIWQAVYPYTRDKVQQGMLKFTAQTIVRDLRDNDPENLKQYCVNAKDRKYQIWQRNPLSVLLWSEEVLKQKLLYLHNNPVRANLCANPADYKYSSASLYLGGEDLFGFITPLIFTY
jgi:putative transposase